MDIPPAQSKLVPGPILMRIPRLLSCNRYVRREESAQHLFTGLQVLMCGAVAEVARAEGGIEHNGWLDCQQVPQQIEPLHEWQ